MSLTHWRAPTGTVRKMNLSTGQRLHPRGRRPLWSNRIPLSVSSIITQLVLLMWADEGAMTVLIWRKCYLCTHKSCNQWLQKHSTTEAGPLSICWVQRATFCMQGLSQHARFAASPLLKFSATCLASDQRLFLSTSLILLRNILPIRSTDFFLFFCCNFSWNSALLRRIPVNASEVFDY